MGSASGPIPFHGLDAGPACTGRVPKARQTKKQERNRREVKRATFIRVMYVTESLLGSHFVIFDSASDDADKIGDHGVGPRLFVFQVGHMNDPFGCPPNCKS